MSTGNYILVTPARNEARFLPALIESIQDQNILPALWVIVSDGSTDDTDAVVEPFLQKLSFLRFIRLNSAAGRSFGAKARAFGVGYSLAESLDFDFVGNLDADITLEPDYYERILFEMSQNPRLGIATGSCWDKTVSGFRCITISENHAVGAVQFFRRSCFEEIGGYKPMSVGGVDSLATLTARMKGWETRVLPKLKVYHHKPVDSENTRSSWRVAYRSGLTEYHIGTCPLFAVLKAVRRWKQKPILASMFIRMFAYFRMYIMDGQRDAPPELVDYLRAEQVRTMWAAIFPARRMRRSPRLR